MLQCTIVPEEGNTPPFWRLPLPSAIALHRITLLTLIRFLLLAWCHAIQPPAFEESHITPLL